MRFTTVEIVLAIGSWILLSYLTVNAWERVREWRGERKERG